MMQKDIFHKKDKNFWCSTCLTMSTRPRITFNKAGRCNACVWNEIKKKMNWKKRENELKKILRIASKNKKSDFDCVVPVSGGKDGSYVCYKLQKIYKVNPLAVTINPPMRTEVGKKNLENFAKNNINLISLDLDPEIMRKMNFIGFEKFGRPYFGWNTAILTAPLRIASALGIDLLFYGEDGEVEYGGTSHTMNSPFYSVDYQKKIYMENGYDKIIKKIKSNNDYFFKYPKNIKEYRNIKLTHWSYYENWDPYRNYLVAKKYFGLQERDANNDGTFTNFAQNDQLLCSLHYYLMYLKFGFGRANQDACIEIRRGAMTRDQAKNLVDLYDGNFDKKTLNFYTDYFQITEKKFYTIIDKFVNKKLFTKKKGIWVKKFKII